ncbi:hypothetical protein [Schumannella soli]|uniref:Uncharacterized protein n=1 Tax=Schumannella soli TaxID=2590779 RepID=A0A506XPS8_9MICO|nr:hypothetical protein [Schumannella soli]TPW74694.1 hypothetical protein FJ657_14015 [Schumannella soli]
MAGTLFTLGGDSTAASTLVANTVSALGYSAEVLPNGAHRLSRGSKTKTFWLGALSGDDFHVAFVVAYAHDESGNLTVRVDRDGGASFLKGGAIGVSKTDSAYGQLVDAIGGAASNAGIYIGSGPAA